MKITNTRVVPVLFADAPDNFEEIVNGEMYYTDLGGNFGVNVEDAKNVLVGGPNPELHELLVALLEMFERFPDHSDVELQPR